MPIGQECPGHAGPSDNDKSKNGILIYSSVSISLVDVTMSLREGSILQFFIKLNIAILWPISSTPEYSPKIREIIC